MENEIKRLEKNRSVTIVVMLVIMLAIVLSACTVSAGGEPHVKSKSEKAIEQAKTILQGIAGQVCFQPVQFRLRKKNIRN